MSDIIRSDVSEDMAHSGIIKVGDFCFLNYCVGNVGGTVEEQINGAFDDMERRLTMLDLTLENVVQMDCLFRDIWNIPIMEKVVCNSKLMVLHIAKNKFESLMNMTNPNCLITYWAY